MRSCVGVFFCPQTLLTSVVLICLSYGCGDRMARPPVDLRAARLAPQHEPVVIDGTITTKDEWSGAAVVPFKPNGRAEFLWDDKGLYVYMDDGTSHPPFGPEEGLCLSLFGDSGRGMVILKFQARFDGSGWYTVELSEAWKGGLKGPKNEVWPDLKPVPVIAFPRTADAPKEPSRFVCPRAGSGSADTGDANVDAEFVSRSMPAARDNWMGELFISWSMLNPEATPPADLFIHVYRLMIERPTSTLRM